MAVGDGGVGDAGGVLGDGRDKVERPRLRTSKSEGANPTGRAYDSIVDQSNCQAEM
jgi:hypothetical protein